MFIPDPDPTIATKEERKEKYFFLPFLVATSITKSKMVSLLNR
jgi:hypothetical protein